MKYFQTTKRYRFEFEEVVNKPIDKDDEVVTEVLIHINLHQHKDGLSWDTLSALIQQSTKQLSAFRIHHTPEGLTITGRYK